MGSSCRYRSSRGQTNDCTPGAPALSRGPAQGCLPIPRRQGHLGRPTPRDGAFGAEGAVLAVGGGEPGVVRAAEDSFFESSIREVKAAGFVVLPGPPGNSSGPGIK